MADKPLDKRIVDAIIQNLSDRKGLGDEWDNCDPSTQREIRATWVDLIKRELAR